MALSQEATVYLRIWTRQPCLGCRTVFQYVRRFTLQRHEMMANDTRESVAEQYRQHAVAFSEMCPCPACGYCQPDMVGLNRSSRHFSINISGFAFLLAAVIATGIGLLPRMVGSLISAGIPLLVGIAQLLLALRDPNRRRTQNLLDAEKLVAADSLRVELPGGPFVDPGLGYSASQLAGRFLLYAASALCLFGPGLSTWPVWLGQGPGIILYMLAGSRFANLAWSLTERALPHTVLSVEPLIVTDETVPPDFQK